MTNSLANAFNQTENTQANTSDEYVYPHLIEKNSNLNKLINVLRETEFGKKLVDDAEKAGTQIGTASMSGAHGSYNDETNVVLMGGGDFNRQVATLAHELRHAQQFEHNDVKLNAWLDMPKEYMHAQWTIEADANVASCMVGWELMQQGKPEVMQAFAKENAHISEPFIAEAEKGGIETNKAQQAAFKGWFKSEWIRNAYEKNYIRNFENRKKKIRNMPSAERPKAFSRSVPVEENAQNVCKNLNGNYLTKDEAKEFFDQPEMSQIGQDTYWAIYRNVRDEKNYTFMTPTGDVMKENGNLTIRPSSYYDIAPKSSSLEQRQDAASKKISALKNKVEMPDVATIIAKMAKTR